jgi:hypothetical protein
MNRVHFAKWVPLVAFALTVPAWAANPADDAKQNSTAATSDQASTGSDSKNQDENGSAKSKGHGPTAVMDRATPTQKSSSSDASKKHPPTARMDRAMPSEKSQGSKGSGDTDAKTTEAPSTPK